MSTAIKQDFTFHLPRYLAEKLQQTAVERQSTPEQIVTEALWFALEPVHQQALTNLKQQISKQKEQSEPEVRAHLNAHLATEEQERLSQLLERNRAEALPPTEQAEMQHLFDRIEAVATEKAAAVWLLSGKSPRPDAEP